MSLNPLADLARLEKDLQALGRIEQATENGLSETCDRLDRIANLLERVLEDDARRDA